MTQPDRIYSYTKATGKGITAMGSFSRFGITQLARVISDLEKQGKRFERAWIRRNGKRYVSYRLAA